VWTAQLRSSGRAAGTRTGVKASNGFRSPHQGNGDRATPLPLPALKQVSRLLPTPAGPTLETSWRRTRHRFDSYLCVPPATTAVAEMPVGTPLPVDRSAEPELALTHASGHMAAGLINASERSSPKPTSRATVAR
jgi:hypothetical protein